MLRNNAALAPRISFPLMEFLRFGNHLVGLRHDAYFSYQNSGQKPFEVVARRRRFHVDDLGEVVARIQLDERKARAFGPVAKSKKRLLPGVT